MPKQIHALWESFQDEVLEKTLTPDTLTPELVALLKQCFFGGAAALHNSMAVDLERFDDEEKWLLKMKNQSFELDEFAWSLKHD